MKKRQHITALTFIRLTAILILIQIEIGITSGSSVVKSISQFEEIDMKICSVKECGRKHYGKGFCELHYKRVKLNGEPGPAKPLKADSGRGTIDRKGYRVTTINGIRKQEQRWVMERHLGRKLTETEVVHHKDRDKLNNNIDNLQLFPDRQSHAKLHTEEDAFSICGNKDWRKCCFCHEYDDTENMKKAQSRYLHQPCANKYSRKWKEQNINK